MDAVHADSMYTYITNSNKFIFHCQTELECMYQTKLLKSSSDYNEKFDILQLTRLFAFK